jgi:hypothetical protein
MLRGDEFNIDLTTGSIPSLVEVLNDAHHNPIILRLAALKELRVIADTVDSSAYKGVILPAF